MDSSTENTAEAQGSPSPTLSCSPNSAPSSVPPPAATTPVSGHNPNQLGQCVYVLSPWGRGPPVFPRSQLPPPNHPGYRFPHPTPATLGLVRFAPYRPYYPPGPPRVRGVHRDFPQEYRYDYYNAYPPTTDYERYPSGQEVQQSEESPAQGNFEPLYSTPYHPQAPLYSYGQPPCWGHRRFFGETPDKSRTIAYYPESVGNAEYVSADGSNAPVNVTKKSLRMKCMGQETTYKMQPTHTEGSGLSIDPPEDNVQIYENLQSASCADGTLGQNEVVIQTSSNIDQDDDKERVTFSSIEEALASIDPSPVAAEEIPSQPAPVENFLQVSSVAYQKLRMAEEKQEEIIKAAKSLFSKRTRTLYHWLYPQTSKNKLKATVSAAWDTLHENEKQFYVSQVLGRFGLQASSLMINPQLGGIRGLPTEVLAPSTADRPRQVPPSHGTGKVASAVEAQQAVDQLFASCEDSESWTSYCGSTPASSAQSTRATSPTLTAAALNPLVVHHSTRSNKSRGFCGTSQGQTNNRRKRSYPRLSETGGQAGLGTVNDHLDEEVNILKRMRESKLDAEFEDDAELTHEMEKFRVMSQDSDRNANCRDGDDFWRRTPDPEDLFTHLEF